MKERRTDLTILNGKISKHDVMTAKQMLNKKVLVQMTLTRFKAKKTVRQIKI